MAVRYMAIKTEPRCAICSHPDRPEIDRLCELRSNREKLGDQPVNVAYIRTQLHARGIWLKANEMTVKSSLDNHLKKHCQRVNEAQALAMTQENAEKQAEMLAQVDELLSRDPRDIDIEGGLRRIIQIGLGDVEGRLARGEKSGVTLDHVMKAAQELSRRGQNEQQASLLRTLADGIGQALGGKPQGELPAGQPVIEAQVAEPAEYVPLPTDPEDAFGD